MISLSNPNEAIKKIALQAVENSKPMTLQRGIVVRIDPLEITVEQRLLLSREFLILTDAVRNYSVDITYNSSQIKETIIIHNKLKAGECVLLIRVPGGQEYIVWSRCER